MMDKIQDYLASFDFASFDWQGAVLYTVCAFVITEVAVWGPSWLFDYMEEPWAKYRTRQPTVYEQAVMDKVRAHQERTRLRGYLFLGWFLHFLTFSLRANPQGLSFSMEVPSLVQMAKENFVAIFILDFYIYLLHAWLHSRHPLGGKEIHDFHHAYRFVGCWYVDHEAPLESLAIASAKYGILAYWAPHPYSAFIYLWIVKFWNVIHHCGHDLPVFQFIDKYFPIIDTPNMHELHHFHHLDGNYAVFFTVFDWFFNTKCRNDFVARTKFGHGKVKNDHTGLLSKGEDGTFGASEADAATYLKRASINRRLRRPRSTKVHSLTATQNAKLDVWESK